MGKLNRVKRISRDVEGSASQRGEGRACGFKGFPETWKKTPVVWKTFSAMLPLSQIHSYGNTAKPITFCSPFPSGRDQLAGTTMILCVASLWCCWFWGGKDASQDPFSPLYLLPPPIFLCHPAMWEIQWRVNGGFMKAALWWNAFLPCWGLLWYLCFQISSPLHCTEENEALDYSM